MTLCAAEQAPEGKFENLHGRDRVTLYSVSRCIFTVVIKEKIRKEEKRKEKNI